MRSWFYHPGTAIAGFLARLLFRARIEGVEHVPRTGAFILVSNHCSNLDPPILGWASGHQVGRVVHFMAKIEMRGWPIVSQTLRRGGSRSVITSSTESGMPRMLPPMRMTEPTARPRAASKL